jgi:hypothetical protein
MKFIKWGDKVKWNDKNLRWGNPSYLLQKGDPGWVNDPNSASYEPPKTKPRKRKYMASNPTPDPVGELIASGEDLCDGLDQHATAIGIKQNTAADTRTDLNALIGAKNALSAADGAQPAAYTALRTADSNGKGFIARAIKLLSITLGDGWSDAWLATGLPDNTVGIPRTQDKRFTALGGLKAYFTANPSMENDKPNVNVTAAIADTLHEAVSNARKGIGNALKLSKDKLMERDDAKQVFSDRYRAAIGEIGQLIGDDDPKWYDFGLNRPNDPAQPGQPSNVHATALGAARVLVQVDGARRGNSFNYYKQVIGTDAKSVKVINTQGTQHTLEGLPVGATVEITVTGVNDAGEGQASEAVSVVVT